MHANAFFQTIQKKINTTSVQTRNMFHHVDWSDTVLEGH